MQICHLSPTVVVKSSGMCSIRTQCLTPHIGWMTCSSSAPSAFALDCKGFDLAIPADLRDRIRRVVDSTVREPVSLEIVVDTIAR